MLPAENDDGRAGEVQGIRATSLSRMRSDNGKTKVRHNRERCLPGF